MVQRIFSSVPLWQFEQLSNYSTINHFVTGRSGGVSQGEVGTFNVSFKVNDDRRNVIENRRRLAQAMGIVPEKLFFPAQTHSDQVRLVQDTTNPDELTDTDALITNTPGICICVMSADCVPVLLFDPVQKAVAAIHAGWRGTVGKIVTRTVEAMESYFGTNPSDLIAGIGPSICPEVYEVGEEVLEAVKQAFDHDALIQSNGQPGKGLLNLWEANRIQLLAKKIRPDSIEVAGLCTYQQSDQFFSARKSGSRAGRFAAGIMLLQQIE